MRSSDIEVDSFTILDDLGQMIGSATVAKRTMVIVNAVGPYQDFDPLPQLTPEMQAFADAEACRLGMLDDVSSP